MERENSGPTTGSPGEKVSGEENTKNEQQKALGSQEGTGGVPLQVWSPQPTVITLQDLIDLPRQIIPEQTYIHLRNAGREAILAIVSLVSGLNNSRRASEDSKIRKRIDVE
jgi:hypothetical protein